MGTQHDLIPPACVGGPVGSARLHVGSVCIPRIKLELLVKYNSYNLARTLIKTTTGDEKLTLFVNKQLFWWSASITLDNNNAVLTCFDL